MREIIICKGKVIGIIKDGVFTKVILDRHLVNTPPAIAIDKKSIDENDFQSLLVLNIERGIIYKINKDPFVKMSGVLNDGYGEKYFLPLDRWDISDMPKEKQDEIQ